MRSLVLIVLFGLTGCVSLPQETVKLNRQVSTEISTARTSHLALVDEYGTQRRGRADDFLRYLWTPRFIQKLLKKIKFESKVCKLPGEMDRALKVQSLVESIMKQVQVRRGILYGAIEEAERDLRAGIRAHYNQLESMNQAVTSNLQSVSDRMDLEKKVREAAAGPLEKILPIQKTSKKLDALLK